MAKVLHSSTNFIPDALRLVLIGGWGWKKTEKERINEIMMREQRKLVEEERKRREEEKAMLNKSNTPDLINTKPKFPHTNLPTTALEERKRPQEKQKDQMIRLLSP